MNTLIQFIIFLAIWVLVTCTVYLVFRFFKINADDKKWAKYTMIAIAGFTAGGLSQYLQEQLCNLF